MLEIAIVSSIFVYNYFLMAPSRICHDGLFLKLSGDKGDTSFTLSMGKVKRITTKLTCVKQTNW